MILKRSILLSLLTLAPISIAQAQLAFSFISRKSTIQTGPRATTYTGGGLTVRVSDGSFVTSACVFNGTSILDSPFPFQPSQIPPCPLGTTGFISSGDIDLDGDSDAGVWWSFAQAPTPAVLIAPNYPHKVTVISTVPSLFPRPEIFPIADSGLTLWYNYIDDLSPRQYQIAGYTWQRAFDATPAGRALHDRTVVVGGYKFGFPFIQDPDNQQVVLDFNKLAMPEAWPGLVQSPLDWGFRFANDDAWKGAGTMEFDPRLVNTIRWNGIDLTNTLPAIDQVRFWIRRGQLADPATETPPFTDFPDQVYPPAFRPYVLELSEIYAGEIEIPPSFLNFTMGEQLVMYFRLDRSINSQLATGFGVNDSSSRTFGCNIMFVDTYEGDATFRFPEGAGSAERAPGFDFDGDGFSNLIEFAMGSDYTDASSIPNVAPADVGGVPGSFEVTPLGDGRCQISLTKRPNVGSSITYFFEHSEDMVTWTRIPIGGNADWVENVNDATTLQVTSVNSIVPGVAPGCFFRVAVELND